MKTRTRLATLLAALLLPLAVAQTSMAAPPLTPAGTVITNQATLQYSVGGLPQDVVPSTETTFNVDRKVNFTVNYVPGAFINVVPGSSDQALTFTVTNQGNDTQDFDLTATQLDGVNIFDGTDNIDAAGMRIFLDNGNGTFGAGDSDITGTHVLDEVAPDQTVTVFIVGNFPLPQVNLNVAAIRLTAVALHGHGIGTPGATIAGGTATDTNGAVSGSVIFTVFADVTDGSNNSEQVSGAFRVAAPELSVNKVANVIWDPINFDATPRHIPGALVRYAITISNAATALASANLTAITDDLNANTTLDPNFIGKDLNTSAPTATSGNGLSFEVTHNVTGRGVASPSYYTNGTDISLTGQQIKANFLTLLPEVLGQYTPGELKPGQSVTVTFNVSIN